MNSLWFLSLAIGLSCALWAISLQQWARRYIRLTQAQPAWHSPEKRARIRAFYANGADKMYIPWAVEGLPTLLHLSLFLFFGGLAIFLFNIDKEVFTGVFLWIGLFSTVYGLITLLPLIRPDSPYYTPLSLPAWFLLPILCTTFQVLADVTVNFVTIPCSRHVSDRVYDFMEHYSTRGWSARMLRGIESMAEEMAKKQSSEIDVRIFGRTIGAFKGALGDDNSLEKVFEAIPGFFSSKIVKNLERDIPEGPLITFWDTLDRFMGHILNSNSVTESVKSHRDVICKEIMSMMPYRGSRYNGPHNLDSHFYQAPVSIERLQAMARWRTKKILRYGHACAEDVIVQKLPIIPKLDGRWIALVRDVLGLNLSQRYVSGGGDDASLATLIDICRHSKPYVSLNERMLVKELAQTDIRHTLPELQHEFCALWNEVVQKTKGDPELLQTIHHLYTALHPGPDAAPTAFSPTRDSDSDSFPFRVRVRRPSFPLCNVADHRPDLTTRVFVHDSRDSVFFHSDTESYQYLPRLPVIRPRVHRERITIIARIIGLFLPNDRTILSEIGDSSQPPATPSPASSIHTSPRPTDASPPGAVATALSALQDNLQLPASPFASFSSPISPSPSHVPPLPNAGLLTLFSTAPSLPTDNSALPRLRARGLVNAGSICFANAVLQLLVHSPPFWNLFRKLDDLKGQHGAPGLEAGGGTALLVDATVRFSEEFMFNEKEPPPLQQSPQPVAEETPRDDQGAEKEHDSTNSFKPVYVYDAMKEKRQFKDLLVRSHGRDAFSVTHSFWLIVLRTASIRMRKSF